MDVIAAPYTALLIQAALNGRIPVASMIHKKRTEANSAMDTATRSSAGDGELRRNEYIAVGTSIPAIISVNANSGTFWRETAIFFTSVFRST
jgi:hypothetical protein